MLFHVVKTKTLESFYQLSKAMFLLVKFFYEKIVRLAFTFACSKVKTTGVFSENFNPNRKFF